MAVLSHRLPPRANNPALDTLFVASEGFLGTAAVNAISGITLLHPAIAAIGAVGITWIERILERYIIGGIISRVTHIYAPLLYAIPTVLSASRVFRSLRISNKLFSYALSITAAWKIMQLTGLLASVPTLLYLATGLLLVVLIIATISAKRNLYSAKKTAQPKPQFNHGFKDEIEKHLKSPSRSKVTFKVGQNKNHYLWTIFANPQQEFYNVEGGEQDNQPFAFIVRSIENPSAPQFNIQKYIQDNQIKVPDTWPADLK